MKQLFFVSIAFVSLLTACADIPEYEYRSRGQPEDLLDITHEQVIIPLDSAKGIDDLISWLGNTTPSEAVVQCAVQDMLCKNASRSLADFSIPYTQQSISGGNQVVLVYQHIAVRDCDQRTEYTPYNAYNLSQPNIGCSLATNMANMVRDKRQFINPAMLGLMDASQAAATYGDYTAGEKEGGDSGSLLQGLTPQ